MDNIEKSSGNKGGAATNNGLQSMSDNDAPRLPAQDYDSSSDQRDMRRLGKTQELKVCVFESESRRRPHSSTPAMD